MRSKPRRQRQTSTQPESNRSRNIIIGAAIVLGVAALLFLLFLSLREPGAVEGLARFAGLSRGHDPEIDYPQGELPPVGGVHDPVWQNCGIYNEPLDTKHVLHSLEHGAVWVTYQPDLSADDVEALQDTVRNEPYVVLSPYPNLKSPVVLSAWGIQLEADSADDGRVAQFVERYQQGPQTPELGATCQNGTGDPIN